MGKGFLNIVASEFWRVWFTAQIFSSFQRVQMFDCFGIDK